MTQQEKTVSITLPRLDLFDIASILLWIAILIPTVQLPSSATYTFARSILLIVLICSLTVFIAYKIMREKRVLFFSASWGNMAVIFVAFSAIMSLILSTAPIDSLFGYDLSFASSAIVLLALLLLYFVLKLAGLSLELAVSRILSVLPMTLLVADGLSLIAYLLPAAAYEKVLGSYSIYFTHLNSTPFALLGNSQQALFVHLLAVVVVLFQAIAAYKRGKPATAETVKRWSLAVLLTIPFSYLAIATFNTNIFSFVLALLGLTLVAISVYYYSVKSRNIALWLGILVLVVFTIFGFIWNKSGVTGKLVTPTLPVSETTAIITKSFLNGTTPMWRQLTGFGVSTFPYLYLQYRSIDIAKYFGNSVYFFKPNEYISELFIEQGALGVLSFAAVVITVVMTFVKSKNRQQLLLEITLLALILTNLLLLGSSLVTLFALFVVLASYFDKVETQPEMLPHIHALDVKESLYTNRSITRGPQFFFAASIILLIVSVAVIIKPVLAMSSYARAAQRLTVSVQESSKKDSAATSAKTLVSAYTIAQNAHSSCKQCAQLDYAKLNAILSLYSYYNGLSETERANSTELRQVKNMILQSVTDLTAQNAPRYDYWLSIAQAYKIFATEEKASSFYILSIQSIKNALLLNPYSVDSSLLYIETLLSLGNDAQINKEVSAQVEILKNLVGEPIQVKLYEGILLARDAKYADAIKMFESMKTDVENNKQLSAEQKAQYKKIADSSIADVNKAQTDANKKTPTVTPTVTPSVPASK